MGRALEVAIRIGVPLQRLGREVVGKVLLAQEIGVKFLKRRK
jgi:hypothetical protein